MQHVENRTAAVFGLSFESKRDIRLLKSTHVIFPAWYINAGDQAAAAGEVVASVLKNALERIFFVAGSSKISFYLFKTVKGPKDASVSICLTQILRIAAISQLLYLRACMSDHGAAASGLEPFSNLAFWAGSRPEPARATQAGSAVYNVTVILLAALAL